MSNHKHISCTKCSERIYFDPKGEGKTIECPECGTVNKNTHYMKESKFEQFILEGALTDILSNAAVKSEVEDKIIPKLKKNTLSELFPMFYQLVSKHLRGTNTQIKQADVEKVANSLMHRYKNREVKESLTEGFHYIIGMKKGKKRYINSKGKWDGENATLKKFDSKASAKAFVTDGYLNQDGMDEILVQFKGE